MPFVAPIFLDGLSAPAFSLPTVIKRFQEQYGAIPGVFEHSPAVDVIAH